MQDFCHLVMVTAENNNKYYDMRSLNNGSFEVTYGRIGKTATTKTYPMSEWTRLYDQKVRKGYRDETRNMIAAQTVTIKTKSNYKPLSDKGVEKLVEYLRSQARETVKRNYRVGADRVTQSMVQEAQDIINSLSVQNYSVEVFNEMLIDLFTTIPRAMSNVQDYLASKPADFEGIVRREQMLLDVMASQVSANTTEVVHEGSEDMTILEAYGLKISEATDKDIVLIKKELGTECEGLFYKAWRVENLETHKKFKEFNKGKRLTKKLYWHGSRTENWWGILKTGLVLRPSSAIVNGKMFGYGLYFAPRARKSVGYTSISGAHWTSGSSRFGFMALCEVAYGKPYNVNDNNGCSDMTYAKLQRVAPGCSCLHAHAGKALLNDEVIVYREDQVNIKYLVELKKQ